MTITTSITVVTGYSETSYSVQGGISQQTGRVLRILDSGADAVRLLEYHDGAPQYPSTTVSQ